MALATLGIGLVFASCGATSQPSALARSVHSGSTTNVHTSTSVRPLPANNAPAVPVPATKEAPLVQKDQNRVTEAQNKIEQDNGRLQSDQGVAREDATQCTLAQDEVQQDGVSKPPEGHPALLRPQPRRVGSVAPDARNVDRSRRLSGARGPTAGPAQRTRIKTPSRAGFSLIHSRRGATLHSGCQYPAPAIPAPASSLNPSAVGKWSTARSCRRRTAWAPLRGVGDGSRRAATSGSGCGHARTTSTA